MVRRSCQKDTKVKIETKNKNSQKIINEVQINLLWILKFKVSGEKELVMKYWTLSFFTVMLSFLAIVFFIYAKFYLVEIA